ncbi:MULTISPECIES: oligopeptide/dipeptide ABC transporter ATP-binding protein [Nocardioides]|uniref:Oligopeptide/dipeptide ABC transporter ATP-binding protein n=1 Tax=Nocardioides vastitatis TaxID=2568655 RepID=A0ABW0ZH20_9ACTN|nr:ABC transporter ATP-binding protein [Nocardioides sp.]THI96879.1 ABC transporter ATP-binding protein [Nocardioides sp.]
MIASVGEQPERELAPSGSSTANRANVVASVRDLAVTFHRNGADLSALRGVNLDIQEGEVLALVGESGSGKSVLGSALMGLLPHDLRALSGTVTVDGVDMLRGSERARRRVRRLSLGGVFQDPMSSLNPTQRIGRQLYEVTRADEESVRLLEAAGIPDARRRLRNYPHELSGGLRQRVMIALATAGDVKLVIADEPTTALDVTVQAQILALFRELCDRLGLAMLFVTHDLGVASTLADRIAVMYAGRIAEVGSASDVLDRGSHPYTRALQRARLTLKADRSRQIVALPGEPVDPSAQIDSCPFAPRCDHHRPVCDDGLPALRPSPTTSALTACSRAEDVSGYAIESLLGESLAPMPTVTDPRPVVEVTAATKSYTIGHGHGGHVIRALDGVDLTVGPNEALSIVGLSGCGKSTLLRAIAGLIPLDSGAITYNGKTRPQIVFQDAGSSLTPWLTLGELIGERLRGNGMSASQRGDVVAATMTRVGLNPGLMTARPGQLSGGQRQRAAIARAVVVPPSLLLCDEPTSALDVSLAATALNMLAELRRELGMAMLFVTHDLAAARLVADRIVVMETGRIVESGPTDDLVDHPQQDLTRQLLAAVPQGQTRGAS